MRIFVSDFRNIVSSTFAIPFGRFLLKWGFLPTEESEMKRQLARYITAIARAAVKALFEERAAIEKERVHGHSP
jgi:hypothetical protein